ncbi:MAG: beta-agarase, partial [Thermoguttaceae bacterium]
MNGYSMRVVLGVVVCFAVVVGGMTSTAVAEAPLLRFDDRFDVAAVEARDVRLSRNDRALRLETGHRVDWPGITLVAPEGRWDLSSQGYIAVDIENVGSTAVEVCCRVDNPGADGMQNCLTERIALEPGEKQTLRVPLVKRMPEQLKGKLFGMRGYPGGWNERTGIDPANVTQLLFFVNKPAVDYTFEISNLRAGGEASDWRAIDVQKLFPLIDRFGQYTHKTWPGKTESAEAFASHKTAEAADLKVYSSPDGWNRYGGWQVGPQLDATGRFRVEKHQGKWWLVDPDGRLFWSHGADCVRATTGYTPITDREHWFAELPPKDSPFGQFYGKGSWAPHGYYLGKGTYETFNFTGANLLRKYGDDWQPKFNRSCHVRLRSWGMNTIANWSDAEIYLERKTAYVATIHATSKNIEGSEGYWGKFPDPFDPS